MWGHQKQGIAQGGRNKEGAVGSHAIPSDREHSRCQRPFSWLQLFLFPFFFFSPV